MTQHLTEQEVKRIAAYTRIGLPESEIEQMTVDLNKIVDSLKPITEYNLEGVEPTFHPIGGLSTVTREDEIGESLSQEEALANAPKQENGSFLIPSILGGGDA